MFFAPLLYYDISDRLNYENVTGAKPKFRFSSFQQVKKVFRYWNIIEDSLFITDAKKVYKIFNKTYKVSFDVNSCRELLYQEIQICNPNLIITLGGSALSLLDKKKKLRNGAGPFKVNIDEKSYDVISSPFICGRGRSDPKFDERFAKTSKSIKLFKETFLK